MSRSKRFVNYQTREVFFYRHNNLIDLVSRKKNYTHEFKSLRELFFKRKRKGKLPFEKEAQKKAMAIAKDLFQMIADDMIMEHDIFVFPKSPFGYMKVSDMADNHPDHKNLPYNFQTDGAWYEGRVMLDRAIQRLNKKHFRFRFSNVQRMKLNAEIAAGKRY